jgi:hypothetical protein
MLKGQKIYAGSEFDNHLSACAGLPGETGANLFWSPIKLCYNCKICMVCLAPYLFGATLKPITAGFYSDCQKGIPILGRFFLKPRLPHILLLGTVL